MPLDSKSHQQVKAVTKSTRNSAAKARRATLPNKYQSVRLLSATWFDGQPVLLAWGPAEPWHCYVLRQEEGRWRCGCFNARRSVAQTCGHEAAAAQRSA